MVDSRAWGLVSVRVTSSKAGEAITFARQHSLTLGRAVAFDSKEARVSALEAFCGAVASDLMETFRRVAREQRLGVDEMEGTVEVEMENPLVYLGVVGESGSPGLRRATFKFYASSFDDEGQLQKAWQAACGRSPLLVTLSRSTEVTTKLQIAY